MTVSLSSSCPSLYPTSHNSSLPTGSNRGYSDSHSPANYGRMTSSPEILGSRILGLTSTSGGRRSVKGDDIIQSTLSYNEVCTLVSVLLIPSLQDLLKMRLLTLSSLVLLGLLGPGSAQNVTETSTSTSQSSSSSSTPVSTSVPEASGSPDVPVPGQGEYPAVQSWCEGGDNATYCPGPVRPL
jgi:hypothetical protein